MLETTPVKKGFKSRSIRIHRLCLEITHRCNLRCRQCQSHSDLEDTLPTVRDSDMTLDQVDKFIDEVRSRDVGIMRLSVSGGEPLVHPQFVDIADRLYRELIKKNYVFRKWLRVPSNGILNPPEDRPWIIAKTLTPVPTRKTEHYAMWSAPVDFGLKKLRHNSRTFACDIPGRCGIILNKYGYFPCGAGGAIVRLFNLEKWFRYELPVDPWGGTWNPKQFREEVCIFCQYAAKIRRMLPDSPEPSPTFREAFLNSPQSLRIY